MTFDTREDGYKTVVKRLTNLKGFAKYSKALISNHSDILTPEDYEKIDSIVKLKSYELGQGQDMITSIVQRAIHRVPLEPEPEVDPFPEWVVRS